MENIRCAWCLGSPEYIHYHDTEWGIPVYDDQSLFECIVLESAQAGLSWITILRKREGYRALFHNFAPIKVANMNEADVERLLLDERIVRHRAKIEATINNAKAFLKIADEFGSFSQYYWGFSDNKIIDNPIRNHTDAPAVTELSTRFSKDLKKRGFKFLGATTCYAFMQATGMVNDHIADCVSRTTCSSVKRELG
ncbi:DNA-3-methyladenine glycosylase I [Marinomonas foliarum]|uniref:DNA-3-methyladenine glycosylase I n=1 Tax=Marinomonas foliarum TaxID=491950 RepID=A0A369AJ71_9GAMM|nr:DNA-3-methyladenine glycosylase I [Marinomonas foliarum]QRV23125.1 DNA-3-methyladenine glycosylase I [Marinomonas foliarum]RCX07484.1 DNA-3-methyladenine glycosylase I [Marinomonas foliarum]